MVMEHNLEKDIHRNPLLTYSKREAKSAELRDRLVHYVDNGGDLLIIGPASCKLFQAELGFSLKSEAGEHALSRFCS
jgi:hypothetical protein